MININFGITEWEKVRNENMGTIYLRFFGFCKLVQKYLADITLIVYISGK